ncbi:MAG: PLP-dependent aminotransferase family protein [Rhizobacter sp.]|nr:PLP-dependent aminotransferase family protein [Rhizobacter sp.]
MKPSQRPVRAPEASAVAALPDFVLRQYERSGTEHDHRQLYRILQVGIRESVLPAGLKLMPSRALAQALGIARNTVVHVYEQLALEGYLQARVGRGTFVAEIGPRLLARRGGPLRATAPRDSNLLSRRGSRLIKEAGAGRLQWGAFTPGVPEVRLFPAQVWNRLHARLWRKLEPQQMSYASGAGDPALRHAIADYLGRTRGVACTPEQVVITSGTQQSLHLVAQLLADPGDSLWLEDPGYWGARSVFRAMGLKLVPVAVDAEGLAPDAAQLRAPPRAMFVSPSHQYPTGALMSHGRRRQILDYAAVHGVWVIEDDYDSEFRYDARPLPALQGLDEHGRVIYLGTFSKTLFPALRLAYLVLPSDLVDAFARALNELYREGQTPQQQVLARFISEGHYASHIRRMRAVYSARHDLLIEAIDRHFGKHLPVIGGDAGLHLVLGLPARLNDRQAMQRVARAGVTTRPLSMYSMRPSSQAPRGLLLGYGAVREDEVAPNFALLADAVQSLL